MSLKPTPLRPIPEDTLAVGRALLAEDDLYRRIGEHYATLLRDEEFADLYSSVGKPAISPALLALVLVLQATEFISDRVALHMLRTRIDWKYALHLPLTDQGFDASVLSEFRGRLARSHAHRRVFDAFLGRFRQMGLLTGRSTQRTDATMILAAVRDLNRTELIFETVRKALEEAARRAPEWTRAKVDPEWIIRYGEMKAGERVSGSWGPKARGEVEAALRRAGAEARALLELMTGPGAPEGLADSDPVRMLARVWGEQFHEVDGQVEPIAWARRDGATARIATPHDPQARFRTKGSRRCVGYGLHLTETADEAGPAILVDVSVEPIGDGDTQVLPRIQHRLEQRGLRPEQQLVDSGYTSGKTLAESRAAGTELVGPVRRDPKAGPEPDQEEARRFGPSDFALDFERRVGVCPAGTRSSAWYELEKADGKGPIRVEWRREDCQMCPLRGRCVTARTEVRKELWLDAYHAEIVRGRQRQAGEQFRRQYRRRAGIEATFSDMMRTHGGRRTPYRGRVKSESRYLLIATAMNLRRVEGWRCGRKVLRHRTSRLGRLLGLASARRNGWRSGRY